WRPRASPASEGRPRGARELRCRCSLLQARLEEPQRGLVRVLRGRWVVAAPARVGEGVVGIVAAELVLDARVLEREIERRDLLRGNPPVPLGPDAEHRPLELPQEI